MGPKDIYATATRISDRRMDCQTEAMQNTCCHLWQGLKKKQIRRQTRIPSLILSKA